MLMPKRRKKRTAKTVPADDTLHGRFSVRVKKNDDARAVKWLEVDGEGMQHESWLSLYGAHRSLIERAVRRLQGEVAPDST